MTIAYHVKIYGFKGFKMWSPQIYALKHLQLPSDLEIFDGVSHLPYNCIFIKVHTETKGPHSTEWHKPG